MLRCRTSRWPGSRVRQHPSTIEGDPIATITRALPGGELEILIDKTQDAFGAPVWAQTTCRAFVEDPKFGFVQDGCDEGVVIPSPVATATERPYQLTCGPMDVAACETWADEIVAGAEKEQPGKTVVSLVITGSDGDYDLLFDDGSGLGAGIN